MLPTLHDKQVVLMDRHDREAPRRGDIVVFHHDGELYIKRVYAMAGDVLEVAVFRNGTSHLVNVSEFPADKLRQFALDRPSEVRIVRATIPKGCIYVVGDNHFASVDSRDFGPVPETLVLGRVVSPGEAVRHLPQNLLATLPRVRAFQRPVH
jgi:signal peptidase I